MNCCTSRCGFCGACDDTPRRDDADYDAESCDYCNRTIGLMTSRISLQGVGVFCKRECADQASAEHARRMQKVSA